MLHKIVNKELNRVKEKLDNLDLINIKWIVEKRMNQVLTSSFTPIIKEDIDWYGKYLKT